MAIYNANSGRKLAYHQTLGEGIGVVFLGGFKSDMEGTKAIYLEDWAKANGRPFLRFDYSGHGQSSGGFLDGSIGKWTEDACAIIQAMTDGPQILVGSSMGGWISLLVAKKIPEKMLGFVGIAAAPDFTEDGIWPSLTAVQQKTLRLEGAVRLPDDWDGGEPYIITQKLIEDGRNQLVLRDQIKVDFPVRLLHGTKDEIVIQTVPLKLLEMLNGDDIQLTFLKDADHRFSSENCLKMIVDAIQDIS